MRHKHSPRNDRRPRETVKPVEMADPFRDVRKDVIQKLVDTKELLPTLCLPAKDLASIEKSIQSILKRIDNELF